VKPIRTGRRARVSGIRGQRLVSENGYWRIAVLPACPALRQKAVENEAIERKTFAKD